MVTPAIENFWRDAQISLKDSVHLEEGRGVKVFYLLLTIFIAQNVWLALSRCTLYESNLALRFVDAFSSQYICLLSRKYRDPN